MTDDVKVKTSSTGATGEYDLHFNGTKVATIRKRQTHYNLRRSVTVTWWTVSGITGFNDGSTQPDRKHHFNTRRDAVDAALRHLGRTA